MRAYEVEMIRDGKVKYFFIRNMETMEIELLPTRFLTHKTRAQESPNTVGSLARSICYYMNFCDGRQMGFTDVCQMDYEAQFNHFTDFLQWLKAGNHTKNLKKTPRNRTCNTYLKNVFGFFSFLEMAEDQFGPLQVLSYGTIHVANSVGVKRRLRFRSFAGYLKEEEREVRAAEKNEIVTILEACTNCRDQLLILMASELGFRIGELLGIDYTKDIDYENGYSLYVGIPFCPSICLYCSFSSYPLKQWKNRVNQYLEALCKEIKEVAAIMKAKGRKLDTVYIGGGTPTTLEPEQLKVLLDALMENFCCENLAEFTIEAGRPDSITREKLMMIRNYPITRISVNPQTMNQETLDIIGRRHTVEETKQAFMLARECGFDNINMDLIVGLPGEDKIMVENTLNEVKALAPDSITVHSLAVKRAARLNIFKDKYQEMTFENNQEIMDMTMKTAYEMEMGPYYLYRQKNMKGNFENVGYAKVDKAGIYNILIMEEKQPIIALGAGGSSKLVFDQGKRIERVENVKDVTNYIDRIDEMIERKGEWLWR